MFNLSNKFKVHKKITTKIKKEFLDNYLIRFFENLEEVDEDNLKIFTPTKNRYINPLKKFTELKYDEVKELSLEEQKLIFNQVKEGGWKYLRIKAYQVPNYKLILDNPFEYVLDYLNIKNHHLYEDKTMIISYLCFLNDKGFITFPLNLNKFYYLNMDHKLRLLKSNIPQEIYHEHEILHKNENPKIDLIYRAYKGDIINVTKSKYNKAYEYIDKCSEDKRYKTQYRQVLDTIYYISLKKKGKLDVDFIINRFSAGGDWYSFAWLEHLDGMSKYKDEAEDFLVNSKIQPQTIKRGLVQFLRYIHTLDEKPNLEDIQRLVHIYDPSRKNKTFIEYLKSLDYSDSYFNDAMNGMYKFFDSLRIKGILKINPIFPKEDYLVNKVHKKLGTHRKALNQELIDEAKKILLENDMEFARKENKIYYAYNIKNHKTGFVEDKVFVPSVTIALYFLLEIPIRGIQVQFLDSGEGDEFRYSFNDKKIIKNNHPFAEKGRMENLIRKSGYEDYDGEYYSLWITTNKTSSDGYEIPYLPDNLYPLLKQQYEFLETYDPHPKIANKSEVRKVSLNKEFPKFYPLFRDLSSRKKIVICKRKIAKLWGAVCRELEDRYREKGIELNLTKVSRGELLSRFDIHSLRVSGITNLIDKGVPLNMVSRYIAGHSSFAMTLWYNSPSPKILRKHMEKAKSQIEHNGNITFENLEKSDIEANFLGGNKYLSENKGMMSIGISGICPFKQCDEGGEKIGQSNKYKPVPQGANGPNCFSCRFFITGPKFIMGQMIEGNLLIREIQKKVQFLDKIKEDIMDCEDEGNIQKMNVLKGQKEIEEDKYRNMLHEWWSRVKTFEASRKMIEKDNKNLVVLGDDTKLALKEMNSFELLHNITTMGEFFPEFTNFTESFNEIENIMNKFLMKNDINPFILNLEGKKKIKACNLMGDILLEISEQYKVENLLEGKVLLKDIPELSGRITKLLDYRRK